MNAHIMGAYSRMWLAVVWLM